MTVIPLVPDSIPILDIRILDGNDQENIWKILKSVFPNWSKEYTKMKVCQLETIIMIDFLFFSH